MSHNGLDSVIYRQMVLDWKCFLPQRILLCDLLTQADRGSPTDHITGQSSPSESVISPDKLNSVNLHCSALMVNVSVELP